jgi:uncharacterized protein (DUF2147 family)
MGNVLRKVAALGMAVALSLGAAPAMAEDTLIGIFRTPEKDMDYRATLCGDGTQLCVQLVELHGKGDNAKNRKYLDTYIIKNLKPVKKNVWRGPIQIQDTAANGDVTITPGKQMLLKACAFIVVCADIKLSYVGT